MLLINKIKVRMLLKYILTFLEHSNYILTLIQIVFSLSLRHFCVHFQNGSRIGIERNLRGHLFIK
mgnify:CR=1 FL=1